VDGQSSRLEQAEDRIAEREVEMEIKGKIEEITLKQLKICEQNMQERTNSIKRPKLESWALKKVRGARKRSS
jgi:hypothetical protein